MLMILKLVRRRVLEAFAVERRAEFDPSAEGSSLVRPEFQVSLVLDAMKLLGAGNGAGSLGSLAAMYYFGANPSLHLFIKVGTIAFLFGALSIGTAFYLFLYGVLTIAGPRDPVNDREPVQVPQASLVSYAVKGVLSVEGAMVFGFCSFACFLLGAGTAVTAIAMM
jgi:hypothetical protein